MRSGLFDKECPFADKLLVPLVVTDFSGSKKWDYLGLWKSGKRRIVGDSVPHACQRIFRLDWEGCQPRKVAIP